MQATLQQATQQFSRTPQVLLAARDVEMRSFLCRTLSRSGYEVCSCDGLTSLQQSVATTEVPGQIARFDLIVCQVELLEDSAAADLENLQQRGWLPPLVLIRRVANRTDTALARRLSAVAVLEENFNSAKQLALFRAIVPVARPPTVPAQPR